MADENKKVTNEAAEKVSKAAKSKNPSKKKNPNGNFFARSGKATGRFFKDFKAENKKIVWPDFKTVIKNTGVVIVSIIVIGIGIWVVDFGLTQGLKGLRKAAEPKATTSVSQQAETTKAEEKTTETTTAKAEEKTTATTKAASK